MTFDCPEGHNDCQHTIPFSPALDGAPFEQAGAIWQRTGDTFETLTLSPSIKRMRRFATKEAFLAAGRLEEYFTESMTCAMHVVLTNGRFEFAGDSE